jgi:hypothetical protein
MSLFLLLSGDRSRDRSWIMLPSQCGAYCFGAILMACASSPGPSEGVTSEGQPQADTGSQSDLLDLDSLGCRSAQGGDDEECDVDFNCGYRIECKPIVDGQRQCDCVLDGVVLTTIVAPEAVCGGGAVREIQAMQTTKEFPPSLVAAAEACGWSYRCCTCREREGNPLHGVEPCEPGWNHVGR